MKTTAEYVRLALEKQAQLIELYRQAAPEQYDMNQKSVFGTFNYLFMSELKADKVPLPEKSLIGFESYCFFFDCVAHWPLFESLAPTNKQYLPNAILSCKTVNLYHGPVGELQISLFEFIKQEFEKAIENKVDFSDYRYKDFSLTQNIYCQVFSIENMPKLEQFVHSQKQTQ